MNLVHKSFFFDFLKKMLFFEPPVKGATVAIAPFQSFDLIGVYHTNMDFKLCQEINFVVFEFYRVAH